MQVRCPSCGHISKTKQDRHIVTMKHYTEVGTADSVAASDPPQTPLERSAGFK